MNFLGGKIVAVAQGALVGGEAHPRPARRQGMGERLRGKEMAAGSPGGDQNEIVGLVSPRTHSAGTPTGAPTGAGSAPSNRTVDFGRLRVTASRKPTVIPSDISDEPP